MDRERSEGGGQVMATETPGQQTERIAEAVKQHVKQAMESGASSISVTIESDGMSLPQISLSYEGYLKTLHDDAAREDG